ncbi:hypothetical protein CRG98_015300 [Punica granatum]|uniref:Uncharacterized protein n=1 Tax=Punica granatum TaxID=22663 RepID=A0A2I0K867_PUNGR|nr:hypothetical protein CRG98_015300 [Punica granatum]
MKDDKEDNALGDYAGGYVACAAILGKARGVGSHEDRAEAQKWGRSTMRARNPKVNAGLKPDAGPEPDAGPKPNLALPWRKSEGRRWPAREGWHDSPVMWGRWPGWTASGHSTSCHGEVKTAGGLPVKVDTICLSCGVW